MDLQKKYSDQLDEKDSVRPFLQQMALRMNEAAHENALLE
jgi:hypothetical protein